MGGPIMSRHPAVLGWRRLGALALVAALLCGCRPASREPRRLPFPVFRAAQAFPEFRSAAGAAASGRPTAPSRFARQLGARAAEGAAPQPPGRSVPLGGAMIGRIPDREGWTWSRAEEVTLIAYSPAAGRPGALVYVEEFSPLFGARPSAEHLRFQADVDRTLAEGFLRLAALTAPRDTPRATRTEGRGLGFRPTRGTWSGWRWAGRNAHGVTLRCGRHLGVWGEPRPLPAAPGGAAPGPSPAPAAAASGYAASLIVGSATGDEETGIHFAVLCVREPRCLVYAELASFLDSIQIADGPLLGRLRTAPPAAFDDLARDAGLAIRLH
jgi:hypothetical protein